MESIKIDRTKLKTYKNYAEMTGFTVQYVYKLAKEQKIKIVRIDGVNFVEV